MLNVSRLYCGAASASDGPRCGQGGEGPSVLSAAERRPVVVWNTTRTCNLRCLHCYSDSAAERYPGELTTSEGKAVIRDLAAFRVPAILFSGGEPLLRRDLFELVAAARQLGLRSTLSTNGTLITGEVARRIREAGFTYIGISLDGIGEVHDYFRGVRGAFGRTVRGFRHCVMAGLRAGLRLTLTRHTVRDLHRIFDFIEAERINQAYFCHLVGSGRGKSLVGEALSPEEMREALDIVLERTADFARRGLPKEILTFGNHADGVYVYLKLLKADAGQAAEVVRLLEWNGGGLYSSGVVLGAIDWVGDVHPDQFWTHYSFGNVKHRPFSQIWLDTADTLMAGLKDRRSRITGRCRACKFFSACGGALKVRADLAHGDPWSPDPACYLTDGEIGLAIPAPVPGQAPLSPPAREACCLRRRRAMPPERPIGRSDPMAVIHNREHRLRLVFWEATAGCNLECQRCRRLDVARELMRDDLSTAEALSLVDAIAGMARPILVLSGGEPLLRPDIYAIARYAVSRGLTVTLATNGTLIDGAVAQRIRAAGIHRCAVSLDGATAATHDVFRRQLGAFHRALEGIAALRGAGCEIQIHTTIARHNEHELRGIYDLAVGVGAVALYCFMIVPVGCGLAIAEDQMLSPARTEEVLNDLYDLAREGRPLHLATDGMAAMTKGCLAGTAVCFISHKGEVFPCGYLPVEAGHIRRERFADIWNRSLVFTRLRYPDLLSGKCGPCEFKAVCAGCRARAYATTGDFLSEEPFCTYQPRRQERPRPSRAWGVDASGNASRGEDGG